MLYFPSKNDQKNFFNWSGVLKKTDPGDGKLMYF